jgi:hypothetical protein
MPQQFFYDAGVRKWLFQIIRLFSEFTVQYGLNPDGSQAYSTVPVIYGDATFNAATIERLNSENVMPSFPMMSIYVSNLKFDRPRTYTPTFQDTLAVRTRQWDANVGAYLPAQANAYSVKRFMPVPYTLQVKVDIVTSNTQQKLQILEQILPLFNPSIEIQKTDNYLDWESLSYLELQDVTWSNRSIPINQGSDSSYDVCTLTFEAPIWMSLPAQVSKMGVIFKVIMDINGTSNLGDLVMNTRQVVTFNNYGLFVGSDNQITCLSQSSSSNVSLPDDPTAFWIASNNISEANISNISPQPFFYGQPLDWTGVLGAYGAYKPGVSMIGLSYDYNPNNEIWGTITINPIDATKLIFNANAATLPSNTLPVINGVVNPQIVAPGFGLANANIGDRYLLTASIGTEWPYNASNSNSTANVNDVVTYTGNSWITTFSAKNNIGNVQFVSDQSTDLQYQWNGNNWVRGWQGPYDAASWRIII